MSRKLFCEISPLTYRISAFKERQKRNIDWLFTNKKYANTFSKDNLPFIIYKHQSLIRRKLGNIDMELQENKAINLSLVAPKITGILIKPNETFSFWKLVGNCTKKMGFKEGLTISNEKPSQGIGGGMCQFTNLLHWLVLHSPLEISEHHHHNNFDLFPDFNRQIPFGTGTSILYNYLDYQFENKTEQTFQLIIYITDEYLCGELLSSKNLDSSYHIYEDDSYFYQENKIFYRHNKIFRKCTNKSNGIIIENQLLLENNAKVMYDSKFIEKSLIREKKI